MTQILSTTYFLFFRLVITWSIRIQCLLTQKTVDTFLKPSTVCLYRHTSEILPVWLHTTAIKLVSQASVPHKFVLVSQCIQKFPSHYTVVYTTNQLSLQNYRIQNQYTNIHSISIHYQSVILKRN